eukprot:4102368-Ditylum_brightwellii.AAC.1
MPEFCKDTTLQVKASPAVLDLDIVPSIDASTQQTSSSATVEVAHTTAVPASSTIDKESLEDEMKVTTPDSYRDNTVQMETSPAEKDLGT